MKSNEIKICKMLDVSMEMDGKDLMAEATFETDQGVVTVKSLLIRGDEVDSNFNFFPKEELKEAAHKWNDSKHKSEGLRVVIDHNDIEK